MPPSSALLLAPDIRALAAALDLQPSKARGQNFVIDPNTVRKIVSQAGLGDHTHVLEVGPGFGSLTLGMLEAGHRVTAIEIDPRMANLLPQTVAARIPGAEFSVVEADALTVDSLDAHITALVANLPYNVSVPVLIHLLELHPALSRVLVMVQAEVGWRLAARPGTEHYGAPSVKVAWFGNWSVESNISRRVFWPEPRVDSVLVGMHATTPPGDEILRRKVFDLVDGGFHTRRKMARQSLSAVLGSVAEASELMESVGLRPDSRCETWSLDDFVALAHAWKK
jgi:16S rRNA (adenine1518-N6/adenine1519-N6)-dimethyltransferase